MDYTTSIHDPEHPAGASPWDNSPAPSPQATQTSFGAISGDLAAAPPVFAAAGNGFEAEIDDEEGFERPRTASTVSGDDTQAGETEDEESYTPGQQQPGTYYDENLSPSQPQGPNRYSGDTARASQEQQQARKPAHPQYKLQAKITGLERAAKKDPILRFDVHVSTGWSYHRYQPQANCDRQTSRSSEPPSSEM